MDCENVFSVPLFYVDSFGEDNDIQENSATRITFVEPVFALHFYGVEYD